MHMGEKRIQGERQEGRGSEGLRKQIDSPNGVSLRRSEKGIITLEIEGPMESRNLCSLLLSHNKWNGDRKGRSDQWRLSRHLKKGLRQKTPKEGILINYEGRSREEMYWRDKVISRKKKKIS